MWRICALLSSIITFSLLSANPHQLRADSGVEVISGQILIDQVFAFSEIAKSQLPIELSVTNTSAQDQEFHFTVALAEVSGRDLGTRSFSGGTISAGVTDTVTVDLPMSYFQGPPRGLVDVHVEDLLIGSFKAVHVLNVAGQWAQARSIVLGDSIQVEGRLAYGTSPLDFFLNLEADGDVVATLQAQDELVDGFALEWIPSVPGSYEIGINGLSFGWVHVLPEHALSVEGEGNVLSYLSEEGGIRYTAVADSGWQFDRWSGGIRSQHASVRIDAEETHALTAHFSQTEGARVVEAELLDEWVASPTPTAGPELNFRLKLSNPSDTSSSIAPEVVVESHQTGQVFRFQADAIVLDAGAVTEVELRYWLEGLPANQDYDLIVGGIELDAFSNHLLALFVFDFETGSSATMVPLGQSISARANITRAFPRDPSLPDLLSVDLELGNEAVDSVDLEFNPISGTLAQAEFDWTPAQVGRFTVSVSGRKPHPTYGEVYVFDPDDLSGIVEITEVKASDRIDIQLKETTASAAGEILISLIYDNQVYFQDTAMVPPGSRTVVSLQPNHLQTTSGKYLSTVLNDKGPGTYIISVNDFEFDYTVEENPHAGSDFLAWNSIRFSNFQVSSTVVQALQPLHFSFEIENLSDSAGVVDTWVAALDPFGREVIANRAFPGGDGRVFLERGETKMVSFLHQFQVPGDYSLQLRNAHPYSGQFITGDNQFISVQMAWPNNSEPVATDRNRSQVRDIDSVKGQPVIAWLQTALNGAAESTEPVVFDGSIYTANDLGQLHALSLEDGDVLWSSDLAGPILTAPRILGDRIFVALSGSSASIHVLDRLSGDTLWQRDDLGTLEIHSMEVSGDAILIAGSNGQVLRLNAQDGSIEWQRNLDSDIETGLVISLYGVFADARLPNHIRDLQLVLFADTSGEVHALDYASGETEWTAETGTSIKGGLSITEFTQTEGLSSHYYRNSVVMAMNVHGEVHAFYATTGEAYRTAPYELEQGQANAMAIDRTVSLQWSANTVYTAHESGAVSALDVSSQTPLWQTPFQARAAIRQGIVIAGSQLYVVCEAGYLYSIDRHSGELDWSLKLDGRPTHRPAVLDGRLYLTSCQGTMYAVRGLDGLLPSGEDPAELGQVTRESLAEGGYRFFVETNGGDGLRYQWIVDGALVASDQGPEWLSDESVIDVAVVAFNSSGWQQSRWEPQHSTYELDLELPESIIWGESISAELSLKSSTIGEVAYGPGRVRVTATGPDSVHFVLADNAGSFTNSGILSSSTEFELATELDERIDFDMSFYSEGSYSLTFVLQTMHSNGDWQDLGQFSLIETVSVGTLPAPQIVLHPSDVAIGHGSAAEFSVDVSGDGTLSYQWFFNGDPVAMSNGSNLHIPSVNSSHAGSYHVEVSSEFGATSSDSASLVVNLPPHLPSTFGDAELDHIWDASGSPDGTMRYFSRWLGYIYTLEGFTGWIFSEELNWIYVWPNQSTGSMWFWEPSEDLVFYTNEEFYPFLYSTVYEWAVFLRGSGSQHYLHILSRNEIIILGLGEGE